MTERIRYAESREMVPQEVNTQCDAMRQTFKSFPVADLEVAQPGHNFPLDSEHNLDTVLTAFLDDNGTILQLRAVTYKTNSETVTDCAGTYMSE